MKKKFCSCFLIMLMIALNLFVFTACGKCNHTYGMWQLETQGTCTTPEIKSKTCTKCKHKVTETLSNANHQYSWTYNNGQKHGVCQACGTQTTKNTANIIADVNGTVEVLYATDDEIILKPVPNEGFYFLKWEIDYTSYKKDSFSSIISAGDSNYTYKAIFTTDASLFYTVPVNIEVENNLEADVVYLPYVYKNEPKFSYFVYPNKNIALCHDVSTIHDTVNGTCSILHTKDECEILPYQTARGYTSFINEHSYLSCVTLKFKDIRNMCQLKLNYAGVSGSEKYFYYNKGDEATINLKNFTSLLGDFICWKDKYDNIISTTQEFTLKIEKDTEFFFFTHMNY